MQKQDAAMSENSCKSFTDVEFHFLAADHLQEFRKHEKDIAIIMDGFLAAR